MSQFTPMYARHLLCRQFTLQHAQCGINVAWDNVFTFCVWRDWDGKRLVPVAFARNAKKQYGCIQDTVVFPCYVARLSKGDDSE